MNLSTCWVFCFRDIASHAHFTEQTLLAFKYQTSLSKKVEAISPEMCKLALRLECVPLHQQPTERPSETRRRRRRQSASATQNPETTIAPASYGKFNFYSANSHNIECHSNLI